MKVALVYDRVNKWGGAERILLALHELFPEAPLYTAFYNGKHASWAGNFTVHPSFLQHLPFRGLLHEFFAWATPLAFETFDFSKYDVVISVTSAEAKNIITHPNTLHICYCLTPTRYLWSGYEQYKSEPGFGIFSTLVSRVFSVLAPQLRHWDRIASCRPDVFVAISETVRKRIELYYKRPVQCVVYPPIDTKKFNPVHENHGSFYLTVSRFVPYKKVDQIVEAFTILGYPLVVIGNGWETGKLKKKAGRNVTIITEHLTDEALLHYYQSCRAFIFAGFEDFGLVAAEAQACGKPVIAYGSGGMTEIIKSAKTGLLYNTQTVDGLVKAIGKSRNMDFDSAACYANARRFDEEIFKRAFYQLVVKTFQSFQKGNRL